MVPCQFAAPGRRAGGPAGRDATDVPAACSITSQIAGDAAATIDRVTRALKTGRSTVRPARGHISTERRPDAGRVRRVVGRAAVRSDHPVPEDAGHPPEPLRPCEPESTRWDRAGRCRQPSLPRVTYQVACVRIIKSCESVLIYFSSTSCWLVVTQSGMSAHDGDRRGTAMLNAEPIAQANCPSHRQFAMLQPCSQFDLVTPRSTVRFRIQLPAKPR
jgi:hypothetical protein